MAKPNPSEEPSPSLRGEARHVVSPFAHAYDALKKWDEAVRHRELSQTVLLAFGAKAHDSLTKIDLAGDMHVRFGETASLLPGDAIADYHPFWLIIECLQYFDVLRVRNAWLWNRSKPAYAKFITRIAAGYVRVHGLGHNKTQKLQLQQGSGQGTDRVPVPAQIGRAHV